jgi:hypothetical protein
MRYFWIVDYRKDSKGVFHPVVIGGRAFTSEISAQEYIDHAGLSSRAEIFPLDTSNQAKATQKIKAVLIRRYKSLDKGMTRVGHEKVENGSI